MSEIRWYCIPHNGMNEVGGYKVAGDLTDFPRGTLLAYGNCCLVTGFKSKKEAEKGLTMYSCKKAKP